MKLQELVKQLGLDVPESVVAVLEPCVKVKAKSVKTSHKFEATGKDFEAKVPTQMKQCVQALGDQAMGLEDWAKSLEKVEGFRTQQSPAKIIAFYRKRMLEAGYVKLAA